MKTYYKSVFLLLFAAVISANAWGQGQIAQINVNDHVFFQCKKTTPVDLFKVGKIGSYISPEHGYWGDVNGVPFDGKASNVYTDIKERVLTNKNIFHPFDTGTYTFYFYVTSPKPYCGLQQGSRIILSLDVHIEDCITPHDGFDPFYSFCYETTNTVSAPRREYGHSPISIAELLFQHNDTLTKEQWFPIEVYSDSLHRDKLGDGNSYKIYTSDKPGVWDIDPMKGRIDTLYLVLREPNHRLRSLMIVVTVFRQASMEITYTPDILRELRDYNIDETITIEVNGSESEDLFSVYRYYMNNKDLNKFYLQGDTLQNQIELPALAFSGVTDFIEIIVRDNNGCILKSQNEVVVNVPFPTVFTPDGDGINDIFFGGEKFRNREFHLEIFNRWGNRLYFGESGWDGTYNGYEAPPGTYHYVIQVKLADGTTKTFKNTVTLIRKGR